MRISSKASIIATLVFVMLWSALYASFYFAPQDLGVYPQVASSGEVRGAQAERFRLQPDEMLVGSRRADGAQKGDTLMLTETKNGAERAVYVVRDGSTLLFEQRLSATFNGVEWDAEHGYFLVSDQEGNASIIIKPISDGTYQLE